MQHALSAVGTPYQWGGNTPGVGLDCSGLTHWAYGQAGVEIPRTAAEQAVGRPVDGSELLPGDLVVWDGHVAMVVGDGQMVEAGDPVQVNPIRTTNMDMGFRGSGGRRADPAVAWSPPHLAGYPSGCTDHRLNDVRTNHGQAGHRRH